MRQSGANNKTSRIYIYSSEHEAVAQTQIIDPEAWRRFVVDTKSLDIGDNSLQS